MRRKFPLNATLLDVGCGTGLFLKEASEFFDCTGIDISKAAIDIARLNKIKAKLIQIDFLNWRTKQKFDVITMWDVLEHVERPGVWLMRAQQSLKTGGHLFMATPNPSSEAHRRLKENWWGWSDETHQNIKTLKLWQIELERAGFRHIRSYPSGLINSPKGIYRLKGVWYIAHVISQTLSLSGINLPQNWNDQIILEAVLKEK